ncbi:nucleotide exchange factor GrpE [Patescibacteria group bacterium]
MVKKSKKTRVDAQIKKLEEQVQELDIKWKRALADYQNLEKRIENDRSIFAKIATAGLIEKLLTTVDDLERAADHIKDDGVSLIAKQLITLLKEEGVEEIETDNQTFDPSTMECVEISSGIKNQVTKTTQKGYMIHDVVLRPAKVEVGSGQLNKNKEK